ncbi:MAG: hypothetical protein QM811_05260 [Pirellulales bacterium]
MFELVLHSLLCWALPHLPPVATSLEQRAVIVRSSVVTQTPVAEKPVVATKTLRPRVVFAVRRVLISKPLWKPIASWQPPVWTWTLLLLGIFAAVWLSDTEAPAFATGDKESLCDVTPCPAKG